MSRFQELTQAAFDGWHDGIDRVEYFYRGGLGALDRLNFITETAHAEAEIWRDSAGQYTPTTYPVTATATPAPSPGGQSPAALLALFGIVALVLILED